MRALTKMREGDALQRVCEKNSGDLPDLWRGRFYWNTIYANSVLCWFYGYASSDV